MATEQDRLAEELFQQAVDLPAEQREPFLQQHCGADPGLRAEVDTLLRHHEAVPSAFLEGRPQDERPTIICDVADHEVDGRQVGRYRIVRTIASGGMGTVYEAMQESPKRRVALKIVRAGLASHSALRRFTHESEILARLRHPGIAQVFEAGTYGEPDGTPYFVMEFIPGARPITQYADEEGLSTRARLELFVEVCDAIQHGHQRGVIHRDLKPGNILIDESGRPKIIDFGVARSTDADITISTLQTDVGHIVGTLRYMSPEQCEGDAIEIDTRSDVYALGVVLFQLLTGQLPYELSTASPFEVPRLIREEEPRRPSAINRRLRGDVETIVLKALEKDRGHRYQSAIGLGQDIRRYLNDEPIEARRGRRWYMLKKTLSRHRVAVGIVSLILLITSTSAVGLGLMYRTAEEERTRAEQSAAVARRSDYFKTIALAHQAYKSANTPILRQLLEQCPPDLRGWEWHYLNRLSDTSFQTLRAGAESPEIALSPDGTLLASTAWRHRIRIWDTRTGREFPGPTADEFDVEMLAFSPDGRWLAGGSRGRSLVQAWSTTTGAVERVFTGDDQLGGSIAFSPDGNLLAAGVRNGEIYVWDTATCARLHVLRGHQGAETVVAWAPRGDRLASGSYDTTVRLWDARTGFELMTCKGHTEKVQRVAFSPTGRHIASTSWDNTLRIWDAETGGLVRTLDGHGWALAFSPDGARVAARWGLALLVWNIETGTAEGARLGHTNTITSVAFHPDGKRIYTGSADETIKVWDAEPYEEPPVLRGHDDEVRGVAVSPDGSTIASASRDDTVRLWDAHSRREVQVLRGHVGDVETVAFSPDGRRLASAGDDKVIRIWDVGTGEPVAVLAAHPSAIRSLAWSSSPDGSERIASACWDGKLRCWDADSGDMTLEVVAHAPGFRGLAFSPDGGHAVTAGGDGAVRIWDAESGTQLREMVVPGVSLQCASFSPDGTRVTSGGNDGALYVWTTQTGELLHKLTGHISVVQEVAFFPEGSRLVSTDYGHQVNIWDVDTGTCLLSLQGHELAIPGLAMRPDGRWFVTASNDHTLRLWDAGGPAE
ncbi:MAG: protein kinase [Phycisphaerales bacterium]|nr:MAG: protein kinase [Phycisphaerales bacterium]